MKINLFDMFDLISEESLDILIDHEKNEKTEDIISQNFNHEITVQNVMDMIPKKKKIQKNPLENSFTYCCHYVTDNWLNSSSN